MEHRNSSFWTVLVVLLLSTSQYATAQKVARARPSLSGTVISAIDGSALKNVRVWILDEYSEFQLIVRPDETGHYSADLQEGYYFVLIGSGGYVPACKSIWVQPGKPIELSVRLSPDHENMIED